jgi:hypothetical protein
LRGKPEENHNPSGVAEGTGEYMTKGEGGGGGEDEQDPVT